MPVVLVLHMCTQARAAVKDGAALAKHRPLAPQDPARPLSLHCVAHPTPPQPPVQRILGVAYTFPADRQLSLSCKDLIQRMLARGERAAEREGAERAREEEERGGKEREGEEPLPPLSPSAQAAPPGAGSVRRPRGLARGVPPARGRAASVSTRPACVLLPGSPLAPLQGPAAGPPGGHSSAQRDCHVHNPPSHRPLPPPRRASPAAVSGAGAAASLGDLWPAACYAELQRPAGGQGPGGAAPPRGAPSKQLGCFHEMWLCGAGLRCRCPELA